MRLSNGRSLGNLGCKDSDGDSRLGRRSCNRNLAAEELLEAGTELWTVQPDSFEHIGERWNADPVPRMIGPDADDKSSFQFLSNLTEARKVG